LDPRPRLLAPWFDELFRLYPEGIGDPRDVVEVGDHLGRVMDRGVIKPLRSEPAQIGRRQLLLAMCQLRGEFAERLVRPGELRLAPVPGDRVHEAVGFLLRLDLLGDLGPDVVGVCLRSVVTVELGRDYRGQQLALGAGEG